MLMIYILRSDGHGSGGLARSRKVSAGADNFVEVPSDKGRGDEVTAAVGSEGGSRLTVKKKDGGENQK